MMNIYDEIGQAEKRIRPNILKTPLMESRELGKLIDGKVYLKLESEQYTGSFKARGSLNKLMSLSKDELKRGTVTASTGNHALGFARALEILKAKGTIYLPENASEAKTKALRNYKVELKKHGTDSLTTELFAKQKAKEDQKTWISPYNDPQIIAGQGTIGIELKEQLPEFDYALITIGGGGLISGVGSYLKEEMPEVKIIGCQPQNSPEMALSVKANRVVSLPEYIETLSDGSAGGIEENAITFPICQKIVHDYILTTEKEIAAALKFVAHTHRKIIEGAAGVAVASLMKSVEKFRGSTVVIIICGGNIDVNKFKEII